MREIRGDTAMRGKRAGAPRRGCLPERVPGVERVGGARPIETGREECGREWCLLAKCSKPFENADPFFLRSFREPRRTAFPFKPRPGTRPPSGYAGGGPRATASRPPGVLKKGTACLLRACDNAAHQQYRKAGLQLRRRRSKPVHRPKRRGQPPCRSQSHLVASIGADPSCEKPICDLAARQKHDRLERAAGPCASPRG